MKQNETKYTDTNTHKHQTNNELNDGWQSKIQQNVNLNTTERTAHTRDEELTYMQQYEQVEAVN